jgi:hypothetical protein
MTEGIATLPTNYLDTDNDTDQTPGVHITAGIMGLVDYTPGKSYIVFGEGTRVHKDHLKSLGGKFNPRLKEKPGFAGGAAWIFFSSTNKNQVVEFVNRVNNGALTTQNGIPPQGDQAMLPTVAPPSKNNLFQYVKYKVYKPATGMSVTIKSNGNKMDGSVIQTETNGSFVDTAYISIGGNTSKLVICNGKWQVFGYMVEHSVFFGNEPKVDKTKNTENPTTENTGDMFDI